MRDITVLSPEIGLALVEASEILDRVEDENLIHVTCRHPEGPTMTIVFMPGGQTLRIAEPDSEPKPNADRPAQSRPITSTRIPTYKPRAAGRSLASLKRALEQRGGLP